MKLSQWIIVNALLLLVVAAIAGLLMTTPQPRGVTVGSSAIGNEKARLVDQRPLQTARRMAALRSTPDEQPLATEVLRIADHEVDLAFADALRNATEHPPQLSPQAKEINARINHSQAAVNADQAQVARLTALVASARPRDEDNLQQQLDLAKAQQELDQDELDDAKADLARTGGDAQTTLQRLLEEHEATEHAADEVHAPTNPLDANYLAGNLFAQFRAWNALREKVNQLEAAHRESLAAEAALSHSHQLLEKRIEQQNPEQTIMSTTVARPSTSTTASNQSARLSALRRLSSDQKNMAGLDKRIQDEQQLSDNYTNWGALIKARQRTALHGLIQSGLWILLIVLLVYLAGRMIDRLFADLTPERKRLITLRSVIRFALQAVGVLLTAIVLFGLPSQMPTILGLAGAGLTVALKDFIVAFFGWFVLMGRNGIRVGDWVEINGVAGEVVEIGLLRTVLMETGNWADAGHPTGRKVAFVNGFAVEGHYFNFSTSGQWLWDEIQLLIRPEDDPYPIIDSVHKLISRETEGDARSAEDEWQQSTGRYRVKSFSAEPAINLRPTAAGVEVRVRYITRAHERYATRTRLNHAIVRLLHGKSIPIESEFRGEAKAENA